MAELTPEPDIVYPDTYYSDVKYDDHELRSAALFVGTIIVICFWIWVLGFFFAN
jgi:hypothetical protein